MTYPDNVVFRGLIEKSGIAPNVISDSATFYWDVRVIPKDKSSQILAEFDEYCRELEEENRKRFADFKIVTAEDHPDVPPLDTSESMEIVPLIRSITGQEELITVSYAAEAGQFAEAGFEAVICGPGDIAQAHRANEFVSKKQLIACEAMLKKLVLTFS